MGKYDTAITIWKKLLVKPIKAERAYKTCLNISTAEELLANYSSSLRYATMALNYLKLIKYDEKDMKLIIERIYIIKERIKDNHILNK
jgi:hypothetical protein